MSICHFLSTPESEQKILLISTYILMYVPHIRMVDKMADFSLSMVHAQRAGQPAAFPFTRMKEGQPVGIALLHQYITLR